jgi:hypothetical protein
MFRKTPGAATRESAGSPKSRSGIQYVVCDVEAVDVRAKAQGVRITQVATK